MKPSAAQMLEAAQLALREKVAPVVTDQWAASALRSVDLILSHLQARVPVEGPMLFEDNADLASVLSEALDLDLDAHLSQAVRDFLAQAPSGEHPSVEALDERNIRGRVLLDDLLRACHARLGDAQAEHVHAQLRAYLLRHLAREQPFYFPTFVGRPV